MAKVQGAACECELVDANFRPVRTPSKHSLAARLFVQGLLAALIGLLALHSALAATYTYDAAGRLKSATNSLGETAVYDYDSRGNLIRIERVASSQLSIISFSPGTGAPGTEVTITGTGFGAETSDNAVAFNGTAASVLSATATQLVVEVPAGASTGTISVTVAGVTVTSDDVFTVAADGSPPVIAGFSPGTGTPGTTITLDGQNLDPVPGETVVTVDGVFVPVGTIDNGQITFDIPAFVGSGAIAVTTPYGTAVSSTPLWVFQTGTDPANVTENPSLTPGGAAQSIILSGPGTTPGAGFLFQGNLGDYLSVQGSGFSDQTSAAYYAVYSPLGSTISSGTVSWEHPSIHLPPLVQSGTYTLLVWGGSSAPQFAISLEQDPTLSLDGASLPVVSSLAGQSKRFIFSGVKVGDNLGLGMSEVTLSSGGSVSTQVYQPDGSYAISTFVLTAYGCSAPQCNFNLLNAPMNGTYAVVVGPPEHSATFSLNATVSHSVEVSLPNTATPTAMNLARFGQNGFYRFNGTAGQKVALQIVVAGGSSIGGGIQSADGGILVYSGNFGGTGTQAYNLTLPETGTYTISIWSGDAGAPLSLTATLAVDAPPVPLVTNGSDGVVADQIGGQDAYFSFEATAGENLGLGLSGLAIANFPINPGLSFTVSLPDGSTWPGYNDVGCPVPQCNVNLFNAPQTGTYLVRVRVGQPTATFSFNATLSDSVVVALPATATPTTMNLGRFGQNGIFTFSGTAGQNVALLFQVPNGANDVNLTGVNPDGSGLFSAGVSSVQSITRTLSQTGTYTVYVSLGSGGTPSSVTATLAVDAAAVAVATNDAQGSVANQIGGQDAYFTFSATTGENLGLGISNLTIAGVPINPGIHVDLYLPDGSLWGAHSFDCGPPQCGTNLFDMPQSGTYLAHVTAGDPAETFSFDVTVSDSQVQALTDDATPAEIDLSRYGENGIFTFDGTAGERIALRLSVPNGANGIYYSVVYEPSGGSIGSGGIPGGSYWSADTANLVLPATGTYAVYVSSGNGGAPTSVTAALLNVQAVPFLIDGSPGIVNAPVPGQWAYLTFDAIAGEQLSLGFSGIASNDGGGVQVQVYAPSGASWTGNWCPAQCSFNWLTAPETGTYLVVVNPTSSSRTFGLSATASSPVSVSLPDDGTPTALNLSRFAQNGYFTFSGAAGTGRNLQLTVPSGGTSVVIRATNPDGSELIPATTISAGANFNFAFSQTGTYTIYVWTGDGTAPASITATLAAPVTSTVFADVIGHAVTPNGGAMLTSMLAQFGPPASGAADPYFADVELLMHFEQTGVSASSGYFPSSGGSYLTVPSSSDFDLSSGDWTIEGFVYPNALTGGNAEIVDKDGQYGVSYPQYDLSINSSGNLTGGIGTGGGTGGYQSIASSHAVPLNAWSHVVFERSGNTLMLYLNGTLEASTTVGVSMTSGSLPLYIDYQKDTPSSSFFNGYLDELRITKGVARYSGSSFTVPTAAFADQPAAAGNPDSWNPADASSNIALSNSNWTATRSSGAGWSAVRSVNSHTSGKLYAECIDVADGSDNGSMIFGLDDGSQSLASYVGSSGSSFGVQANNSGSLSTYHAGSQSNTGGAGISAGGYAMVAVDYDAGKIWFGVNGSWMFGGNPATGANPSYSFTPGTQLYLALSEYSDPQQTLLATAPAQFHGTPPAGFAAWGN